MKDRLNIIGWILGFIGIGTIIITYFTGSINQVIVIFSAAIIVIGSAIKDRWDE